MVYRQLPSGLQRDPSSHRQKTGSTFMRAILEREKVALSKRAAAVASG